MESPLEIRSVSLTDVGGAVLFEITFDRAPDFSRVDASGRNYDAFQLTLTHDMENPSQFRDVWMQGIHIEAGVIPIYPMLRATNDFGPLSASVPYVVSVADSKHVLSFRVPYAALNSPESVIPADGRAGKNTGAFYWFLDTFQYGESPNATNHASGQYPAVPQAPKNLRIDG